MQYTQISKSVWKHVPHLSSQLKIKDQVILAYHILILCIQSIFRSVWEAKYITWIGHKKIRQ